MATSETRGVMAYVDDAGGLHIHYPVTEGQLVTFDNTKSGLKAESVEDAINELALAGHLIENVPTQSGSLAYTGSELSPNWDGYSSSMLEIGGTVKATAAGTYEATFTPKPGYAWNDGTQVTKTATWTIGKATPSVVAPSVKSGLTYTGSAQALVNAGSTSGGTLQYSTDGSNYGTGIPTGINATSYTVYYKVVGDDNYNDVAAQSINVSIAKASLTVPSQNGSLTYSGSSQSPSWNNYDSSKMTLGGTTSGTNATSYDATFALKDAANYQWADTTTAAKTVSWSIGKASGSLSISPTSLSFTAKTAKTIAVTRAGDGAITAKSSNTSVATVSVSGTTVTVTPVADGSATITISVAAGTNHTAPSNRTCSASVSLPHIYGASWDGTSTTAWSRTDEAQNFTDPVPYVKNATSYSSPFDSLQPWAGMVKSERTGGTMVAIPKFWYKITQSGNGIKVQIADKAVSGYSVSPAHMDRGDGSGERATVYIGRYHCGATAYKSVSGQKPKVSITRSAARSAISNLGSNIWQADFLMRFTIWLLYIVEFANWDSQSKIGYGCGNNSAVEAMGASDDMPYHTGTMQTSRTTYGVGTQYRYIEGLWDNCLDWMDGCYYNSNGLNLILDPSDFSDSSNGTSVGTPSNGYPSAFTVKSVSGMPVIFIPTAASGSASTYSCDSWYFLSSYPCLCVGGSYYQSTNYGLFYVGYCSGASGSDANIGARLQELP